MTVTVTVTVTVPAPFQDPLRAGYRVTGLQGTGYRAQARVPGAAVQTPAAEGWLALGNEYRREENAYRKTGVPEDRLRINQQTIVHDFFDIPGRRWQEHSRCHQRDGSR